ncbi:MAG: GNAT family N-acetyltransferase [Hyphomicrobiales bacterium]|nr:GNAT family N-acetyltransferase [Hyphomicrobiales bacterium]MDE2113603.1 GNAT family N-acetyltransferase [Hyphomicrobiales bacterium]
MTQPLNTQPALAPQPVSLSGQYVDLFPLDAARDGESLFNLSRPNPELFDWLFSGPFATREALNEWLEKSATSKDSLFFSILDKTTRQSIGLASLMRIDTVNRVIEIGNVLFTPALQGTRGATEAFALLATYVFDTLGYRRFEWKCNALNAPSRRAALRYGFQFEGIFRQHMFVKGKNRDTAWFSMLDSEWPARRQALQQWLSRDNFDANGVQKTKLTRNPD